MSAAGNTAQATAETTPARVLVVDDNPMNRDVLSRRLQRDGHVVETAEDGAGALDCMAQRPYDLVLLDVMMPGMDGYEVLTRLKRNAALSHVPVVMISALGETDSVVKCLALGADDYLTKPFDPLILRARVEASLAKKRLHDAQQRYMRSMERELEIGRAIQAGFLPETLPQPRGWQIAAHFRPARQVAGDFYDAFEVPGLGIAVVIADVCDKGVGAALYMALFRTLLRAGASRTTADDSDAASLLLGAMTLTNDYIARVHARANMFATVFFGILDPDSGRLVYINAGHEPPMIAGGGRIKQLLELTAPALGLLPEQHFGIGTAELDVGDILFGYTDGVVEATGVAEATGETPAFGEPRLVSLVTQQPDASADVLLETIAHALEVHGAGADPFDDITMIAVRRAGP